MIGRDRRATLSLTRLSSDCHLSQAMIALPYYLHTYPAIVQEAKRWLAEALADS